MNCPLLLTYSQSSGNHNTLYDCNSSSSLACDCSYDAYLQVFFCQKKAATQDSCAFTLFDITFTEVELLLRLLRHHITKTFGVVQATRYTLLLQEEAATFALPLRNFRSLVRGSECMFEHVRICASFDFTTLKCAQDESLHHYLKQF